MNENRENFRPSEQVKSREVFTDDTDVIGPLDDIESLEALPISCAVLTATKPEQQIAGMAHLSLGLKTEGVAGKINELKTKFDKMGVRFSDSQIRLLNADEILNTEINTAIGSELYSELIPAEYQGVRVSKITGEVTFFTTFPEEQE